MIGPTYCSCWMATEVMSGHANDPFPCAQHGLDPREWHECAADGVRRGGSEANCLRCLRARRRKLMEARNGA